MGRAAASRAAGKRGALRSGRRPVASWLLAKATLVVVRGDAAVPASRDPSGRRNRAERLLKILCAGKHIGESPGDRQCLSAIDKQKLSDAISCASH